MVGQSHDSVRVLLTSYSDIESTIVAVNKGRIHWYVQKPWETEELQDCLRTELGSKPLKLENQQSSAFSGGAYFQEVSQL